MTMSRIRLWVPENHTPAPHNNQEIALSIGIHGIFHADLINRAGVVTNSWRFPNIITDLFLDGIGSGSLGINGTASALTRLRAGTGSRIPAGTDTDLEAPIGNFVISNGGFNDEFAFVSASVSGTYQTLLRTRLFDFNDCSGTIREFGWTTANTSNTTLVRSLVRDVTGSPTFIEKTNDDQLRVRYELRMMVPTTTSSYQLVVANTTHSLTLYPNDINDTSRNSNSWGWLFDNFGGNGWNTSVRLQTCSSHSFSGGSWNPLTPIILFDPALDDVRSASLYISGTNYMDTSHSWDASNTTINAYPSGILAIGAQARRGLSASPSEPPHWVFIVDPPIQKSDIQSVSLFIRWRWARSGTT